MDRPFRALIALIAWAALVLQYGLLINNPDAPGFWTATGNFFGYFTILTNILVAVSSTVLAAAPNSAAGGFFGRDDVRSATAFYILIVGIVYHILLRAVWDPQGWQLVADYALHYATPALMLVDWLAVVDKSKPSYRQAPVWLVYPVIYCVYTIVRGVIVNWYPYHFIDLSQLGVSRTAINIAALWAAFFIGALAMMAAGRLVSKFKPA